MEELPRGLMGGESFAGVITVSNWTMCGNGDTHLYIWARKWVVLSDKLVGRFLGQKEFRSSEKWSLVGYGADDDMPMIFIPGCQVKGWFRCASPPPTRPSASAIYNIGEEI